VNVIISGGFSTAYRQLLPEFEKTTGTSVTTGSGASQGKGPLTIASQLERGVPFDVVIMSREGLGELIAAGRIVAGSDADLATAALGAAVRAGAPKPDVTTVEGFKRALLGAKVVAVPQSTSGIYSSRKSSRNSASPIASTSRSTSAARNRPRWSPAAKPTSRCSPSAS